MRCLLAATEHMMEDLYGAWWLGTCVHAPAAHTSDAPSSALASLRVRGLQRLQVEPALLQLGLVPELATEDLVLLQHERRMLAFACEIAPFFATSHCQSYSLCILLLTTYSATHV